MNYRPISLLNTSLKITDAIIFNKILPKLIKFNFSNERQYGATKTKSCLEPIFNL